MKEIVERGRRTHDLLMEKEMVNLDLNVAACEDVTSMEILKRKIMSRTLAASNVIAQHTREGAANKCHMGERMFSLMKDALGVVCHEGRCVLAGMELVEDHDIDKDTVVAYNDGQPGSPYEDMYYYAFKVDGIDEVLKKF